MAYDENRVIQNLVGMRAVDALINIGNALGAYSAPLNWKAIQAKVRAGVIGNYVQPGDQVEVDTAEIVTAAVTGEGITAATVDKDTFLAAAGTHAHDYEFTFDGHAWHYGGNVVTLSDFGISVTGTPADGDTVEIHRSATTWDFDVQGIDEDEPVNAGLDHVLTIQAHKIFALMAFDPAQYLYVVDAAAWPDGLPAGTYNITLDHGAYDNTTAQDGTYQFTITQPVPVGGGIRHTQMGVWRSDSAYTKDDLLAGTFVTYAADRITTIESGLVTTEGAEGTNLGTATCRDPQYKVGDYINFTQRQGYGSSRWSTSWLRQVLNSTDAEVQFVPGTPWSRPASGKTEGFLHTLDPELKAVLGKVRKRYALSVADGYGYEDVEDLVTLNTMTDMGWGNNNAIPEGPVDAVGNVTRTGAYSFWDGTTNADRIKYQGTTARYWWLGSTYPSSDLERNVNSSGALSNHGFAHYSYGVVPSLYII